MPSASAAAATSPAPDGGVHDDDPLDARGLRRHGAHDERRDEPARHVDADRASGTQRRSSTTPGSTSSSTSRGRCASCQRRTRSASASSASRGSSSGSGDRARRLDAVELERPLAHGVEAALLDVVDDPHETIRSTGTSRIDDAPAASSFGSSRQTSAAGTSACTATMPGSASGSTLGAREPGTSA